MGDHPGDPAACALAWKALRLAHDRVARRLDADLSRECGLGINEFDLLLFLRSHPEPSVRMAALTGVVPLSQPALSRLVSRLEGRGLVARAGVEGDGRGIVVRLTEEGSALAERALDVHARAVEETLTGKFTEEERAALLRTLRRIGA